MGVEQGQIGKTEGMAEVNKNQDPGADSLSAARPYRPLSLRARLILLLFVIAIPLTGMALGFQKMIASYSASYDAILANLKTANEYNIKFKSDMEYSMYRVMIGLIDAEQFENGDIVEGETKYATVVKNPHSLIASARQAFGTTIEREPGSDCDIKIRGILSCLDSLERAVDKMIGNAAAGGYYDENVNIWENDIQGLCSMIQDYITQYTYYEMINMEQLQKELKVQMADQMQSYLALLLVVLVVGMFLAVTITKSITEPLQQLQRTAEQLGRGNLNARARTGGLEEINVLARAFNQMSDRIRRLLDKTRQEQKNLRFRYLAVEVCTADCMHPKCSRLRSRRYRNLHQEQISPHFLYNTLDSIVWMAEGGNNRQVVEMTTDLSDFFRTVLSGGRDFITIEEEESHIRSYLKIQKIRYEDILDYSIEIEPSIRHRIVLKMLLQPLVENALYHGIKNKRGGGCIVLRGYEDRNGLVFEVEDDGIGMDEAELAAVRAKLTLEPEEELAPIGSGGFGLHNVAQRIQMYYGDQAEILVESEKNIGTCFKVYLGNQKKS